MAEEINEIEVSDTEKEVVETEAERTRDQPAFRPRVDIYDTDRFVTLIYLMIDPQKKRLKWVRAGHDAALLYDPADDTFVDLYGPGLALGWDQNYPYEENEHADLTAGHIIFLGTDGIWETFDKTGNPFGKEPLKDIIRQKAKASAEEMIAGGAGP